MEDKFNFVMTQLSRSIYSLKDYLNQHCFNKWRYSEFDYSDVFVYIFQFSEKFQELQKAQYFHMQV